MARQLKVYRTVAGFHDAYVAAPSQKAALAAWGSDKDLFARGDAELVDDPSLMAAPLAVPGTIVRLSRGTTAQQIAAMPDVPREPRADGNYATEAADGAPVRSDKRVRIEKAVATPAPEKAKAPKPSTDRLEATQNAFDDVEATQRAEVRDLEKREADLARDRRELERRHRTAKDAAQEAVDDAKSEYDAALRRWKANRE